MYNNINQFVKLDVTVEMNEQAIIALEEAEYSYYSSVEDITIDIDVERELDYLNSPCPRKYEKICHV